MQVKIKKLSENAVIPSYAKNGDAGLDLTATSRVYDEFGNVSYGTGLAFEIPKGYVGLLFPRSSNCKKDLILSNSVGVLDNSYRGEVSFKFKPSSVFYEDMEAPEGKLGTDSDNFDKIVLPTDENFIPIQVYEIGDRIGQLIIMPYPEIEFIESDELSETERGEGGYGSTGR